jgi:hypothetical protein
MNSKFMRRDAAAGLGGKEKLHHAGQMRTPQTRKPRKKPLKTFVAPLL